MWTIQVFFLGEWSIVCRCIHLNPVRPMSKRESKKLLVQYQRRSSWQHRLQWEDEE